MTEGTAGKLVGSEAPKARYLPGLAEHVGPVQERELRSLKSRAAIVASATRLFAREGFYRAKIGEIAAGSGYSRQTCNTEFGDRDACFKVAFREALEQLGRKVAEGMARSEDGSGRVGHAVEALLGFVAADSDRAKLIFIEARVAASAGIPECLEKLSGFWEWLGGELGSGAAEDEASIAAVVAAVGGIEAVLAARLRGERAVVKAQLAPLIEELATRAFWAGRKAEGVEGGVGDAV